MATIVNFDTSTYPEGLKYRTVGQTTGSSSYALTGARALFTINNEVIAWGREWTFREDVGTEPVEVVGMFEPVEYAITSYRITLTLGMFRILGRPTHDITGKGFGFTDKLTTPTPNALKHYLLTLPEMSVELYVYDPTKTDNNGYVKIGTCHRTKYAGREFRFGARELIVYNITFNAIYFIEEND